MLPRTRRITPIRRLGAASVLALALAAMTGPARAQSPAPAPSATHPEPAHRPERRDLSPAQPPRMTGRTEAGSAASRERARSPAGHAPRPGAHAATPTRHAPARPLRHPVAAAAPPPSPAAPAPVPAAPPVGSNTGLPLPRFASLRTDDVNLRAGPGTRYPIEWVYKRRDLPVEIEREFDIWRLVRDADGVQGWVHQATLGARRTVVVIGQEQVLRAAQGDAAGAVAQLKPGVIARVRGCAAGSDWCDVQVGDYRGFLRRGGMWGLLPGEAVQ